MGIGQKGGRAEGVEKAEEAKKHSSSNNYKKIDDYKSLIQVP